MWAKLFSLGLRECFQSKLFTIKDSEYWIALENLFGRRSAATIYGNVRLFPQISQISFVKTFIRKSIHFEKVILWKMFWFPGKVEVKMEHCRWNSDLLPGTLHMRFIPLSTLPLAFHIHFDDSFTNQQRTIIIIKENDFFENSRSVCLKELVILLYTRSLQTTTAKDYWDETAVD